MARKNSNRYYNENKQNSIANSLMMEEKTGDYITTTNTTDEVILTTTNTTDEVILTGPIVIEEKENELDKYEVVRVLSFEKKALCDVNVRSTPEKKNGNIVRVLKKGEAIQVFENMGTWSKVEGDRYIMSEFLG